MKTTKERQMIEELTQEQEVQLDKKYEEWLAIGLTTGEKGEECRETIEKLILDAYKMSGVTEFLDDFKFHWTQSPMEAIKLDRELSGDADYNYNIIFGNHEAGWLSFYDYFDEVVKLHDECRELQPLIQMAKHGCGWIWPRAGYATVSELPTELHVDDDDNLHNPCGAAVLYSDGWGVWCWHGTRVPREWIENTDGVDRNLALTWENIEQRRCLCEIIGWDKVLEKIKDKKTIDVETHEIDGPRELIEVTLEGRTSRFVIVTNPPDKRKFALGVPVECETCHEAVAWSYGLSATEYKPIERG